MADASLERIGLMDSDHQMDFDSYKAREGFLRAYLVASRPGGAQ